MKAATQHKKSWLWKAGSLMALLGFVFLLWATTTQHQQNICTAIEIQFDQNQFLQEADVLKEVQQKVDANIEGKKIYSVDINRIEAILQEIPFVKQADVFMDNTGKLTIKVKEKQPLVRVVNNKNIGYYIDDEAQKFEVSKNYTARVPIVSGYINDNQLPNGTITSTIGQHIFELANFIYQEPLWQAMVEQIYVNQHQEFIIIPKVGNFEIELGAIENLEHKFKKLLNFYEKGLITEYNYESIKLKYEKQIVCSLKQPAS